MTICINRYIITTYMNCIAIIFKFQLHISRSPESPRSQWKHRANESTTAEWNLMDVSTDLLGFFSAVSREQKIGLHLILVRSNSLCWKARFFIQNWGHLAHFRKDFHSSTLIFSEGEVLGCHFSPIIYIVQHSHEKQNTNFIPVKYVL